VVRLHLASPFLTFRSKSSIRLPKVTRSPQSDFLGDARGRVDGHPTDRQSGVLRRVRLLRIRDGKVVEHWSVVDMAGLLQQLGAMPDPNA
jgi:predicted SnoaL-like aldol condensation-catalyzing enzyme